MNFKVYFKNGVPYRIYIPKRLRDQLFRIDRREISLYINSNWYVKRLPDSFFSNCSHLDGAYNNLSNKGNNELKNWLIEFQVKEVNLKVLQDFQKFEINKIK